ncbi:MAG: site-specific DNA-methyltransferase [Bacteroidetes bacterium]|nr:site-specific DNA-methyltransferase [Bacteroidota bacterium]
MRPTIENTAQENVIQNLNYKAVLLAKFVGNLCDECATSIVQEIVKIKTQSYGKGLQVIQDFIIDSKKCILIQDLVNYVEKWDSIDTTQTTQNLLKLFGFANRVIKKYIPKTKKLEYARFKYSPKASVRERWFYCKVCQGVFPGNEKEQHIAHAMRCIDCGVNFNPREEKHDCQEQYGINTTRIEKGYRSPAGIHNKHRTASNFIQHPTQKPEKLIREYLIKLITPPGEIVLDPFGGSGTTAVACRDMGVNSICIDRDRYYCLIAKARESGEPGERDLIKELVTSVNKNNGNGKAVQLEIFEEYKIES